MHCFVNSCFCSKLLKRMKIFQTHSPRLTPKYRKNRIAPPPPPQIKTSTPFEDNSVLFSRTQQISTESLSSITTDSGSKSMETSESHLYTTATDIEKEKIEKDEENRNRQTNDNYLQSKFFLFQLLLKMYLLVVNYSLKYKKRKLIK